MQISIIKKICCAEFGLDELILNERKRKYCFPNQVAQYLSYISNPQLSLEKIGKEFDKSGCLVFCSSRTITQLMETDKEINNKINYIINKYGIPDRKEFRMYIGR